MSMTTTPRAPHRRAAPTLLLALALLVPAASASAFEFGYTPVDRTYHSPQHWAFEIKFGTYTPHIDDTPNLVGTPFADLYNNQYDTTQKGKLPSRKLLTTLEIDWQFWHGFGSLGLAFSVGYQRRTTHSFNYDMSAGIEPCQVPNCMRSSDTTALNLIPLTLEVVYRFDVLANRYKVPLVPYLKIGLGYDIWVIQNGAGGVATALQTNKDGSPDKAYGGTAGFVMHPGLALQLDVIDRKAAQTLDAELGINHTYVFAELNYSNLTGLGFKDKLNLSDTSWNAGVAFEF
jgi:hypothetical protein